VRKQLLLIVSLLSVVLAAACGGPAPQEPGSDAQQLPTGRAAGDVAYVRADVARVAAPDASQGQVGELVQGLNGFALEMYRRAAQASDANLVFSPYSIALAFSMVYGGARGETQAQMADVLRFLPQAAQHPAFNALDQYLAGLGTSEQGSDEGQGDPFQLNIANAVWGQAGFPFRDDYLKLLAAQYGAGLRVVDFAADTAAIIDRINAWVAEQTAGRIEKIVPPAGVVTPDTRLVLANAIYFNASWLFPFQEEGTADGPFTRLGGGQVTVPLMHRNSVRAPYTEGQDYQAIFLPYTGRDVEMLVLLPQRGAFQAVEAQLSTDFLQGLRDAAQERDVTLALPRFDLETDLPLKQLLQDMGLTAPFDAGAADFSGMAEGGGLFISAALHQANITVNETGTEAAAATVVAMDLSLRKRAEMSVDHPFIFAVVERETGTILFLGRVLDPAER
jgi:serpin B